VREMHSAAQKVCSFARFCVVCMCHGANVAESFVKKNLTSRVEQWKNIESQVHCWPKIKYESLYFSRMMRGLH
jgi:hypothetical protein